ncbi:MAG: 50S ribosomal protein L4 [Rhodospirillaceae bacterium]|nr:50S ribosomal protein L4 [Rhodospirillaceae bacterium]
MKCDVINLDSKSVGSVDLADAIFGLEVREDILHRVVRWQLAKRQSGNHKTKTVGEVSGTNKKPFKQKGTGRARQGNARAPQLRGGGKAFGPVVRSHAHSLNKKVRRLGLKTALSAKAKEGSLIVLDEAKSGEGKTKKLAAQIKNLGWKSALIIDGPDLDSGFCLAARNIIGVDVLLPEGANVYDILRREKLVLTKAGLEKLEERLK